MCLPFWNRERVKEILANPEVQAAAARAKQRSAAPQPQHQGHSGKGSGQVQIRLVHNVQGCASCICGSVRNLTVSAM